MQAIHNFNIGWLWQGMGTQLRCLSATQLELPSCQTVATQGHYVGDSHHTLQLLAHAGRSMSCKTCPAAQCLGPRTSAFSPPPHTILLAACRTTAGAQLLQHMVPSCIQGLDRKLSENKEESRALGASDQRSEERAARGPGLQGGGAGGATASAGAAPAVVQCCEMSRQLRQPAPGRTAGIKPQRPGREPRRRRSSQHGGTLRGGRLGTSAGRAPASAACGHLGGQPKRLATWS